MECVKGDEILQSVRGACDASGFLYNSSYRGPDASHASHTWPPHEAVDAFSFGGKLQAEMIHDQEQAAGGAFEISDR